MDNDTSGNPLEEAFKNLKRLDARETAEVAGLDGYEGDLFETEISRINEICDKAAATPPATLEDAREKFWNGAI
jgi:hypothetical protein